MVWSGISQTRICRTRPRRLPLHSSKCYSCLVQCRHVCMKPMTKVLFGCRKFGVVSQKLMEMKWTIEFWRHHLSSFSKWAIEIVKACIGEHVIRFHVFIFPYLLIISWGKYFKFWNLYPQNLLLVYRVGFMFIKFATPYLKFFCLTLDTLFEDGDPWTTLPL